MTPPHHLTQHIGYGLTPLPFETETLIPSVATSYMLGTLDEIAELECFC